MRGHSSIIIKSMVACLAVLGGAGLGGLAAGFNARATLPPRPAVSAAIADLSASEAVNLRFPAHWTEAAAEEAAPHKVVLASADSSMVLFRPSPTYPVVAPPVAAAEPPVAEPPEKPKPAAAAKPPAPKPVHRSNTVLNDAQIASIKRRLNLTPDQERYWPAVEAELRKMEYAKRRATCEAAARSLGVPALRDVTDLAAALSTLDDEVARRRTRHVVTENERVLATIELLRSGRPADIGPLLTASHASLRDDFEVTVPELDVAVEAAVDAGALGARMTGGGFGGCVIALAPANLAPAVAGAVAETFASRGFASPTFIDATPAEGTRRDQPR